MMSLSLQEQNKLNQLLDTDFSFDANQDTFQPINDTIANEIDLDAIFNEISRNSTPALVTEVDDAMNKNSIAEWLDEAAASLDISVNNAMFSSPAGFPTKEVLSSIVFENYGDLPFASPLQDYRSQHNSSPMLQPNGKMMMSAQSLFPSPITPTSYPTPNNQAQFQPQMFTNIISAVQSGMPSFPRSQSTSPQMDIMRSGFMGSPFSFTSSPLASASDIKRSPSVPASFQNLSLDGIFGNESAPSVPSRRNLGVRTKAITSTKTSDGSVRKAKVMKELVAECGQCGIEIATLILHGTEIAIHSSLYRVEMICSDCEVSNAVSSGSAISERLTGRFAKVECDCCKRNVAIGGARALLQNESDNVEWIEPQFGVEVVCAWCRDKYGFCTECGGGNRFRTGKWRPLQMFEENRRTCKFLHTRIGKTPVRYQTFHIAGEFSASSYRCIHGYGCGGCSFESVVKELRDMYFDRKLFAYAVPVIMETVPSTSSWKKLNEKILEHWNMIEEALLSPASSEKRRYIDFAFITPPVPRRKGKADKEVAVTSDQMIAGFVMGEWDLNLNTFYLGQRCNRGVGGDPCSMVLEMSKNLISRAVNDATTHIVQAPLPTHIYVTGFTRFQVKSTLEYLKYSDDRSKLHEDMEFTIDDFSYGRIGFSVIEGYVKRFQIEPKVLEHITPATNDDTLFIVNIRDLTSSSLISVSPLLSTTNKRRKV